MNVVIRNIVFEYSSIIGYLCCHEIVEVLPHNHNLIPNHNSEQSSSEEASPHFLYPSGRLMQMFEVRAHTYGSEPWLNLYTG